MSLIDHVAAGDYGANARLVEAAPRVYERLLALYESIPHNGEPGSALRRECEATKKLIRELETGHA